MNPKLVVISKEIHSMFREKSFALMIILELMLVSASGFMSLGYVIFTSPESSGMLDQLSSLIYVGVVTESVDEMTSVLEKHSLNYRFYKNFEDGKKDFKDGKLDALIVGDIDYEKDPSNIQLYLPSNSPKNYLTRVTLKKVLVSLEKNIRAVKVGMHAPDFDLISYKIIRFDPHARYLEVYYVFTLPLIIFLPALIAGSLSIDTLTQEFEDKSILNLLMVPLSSKIIVLSKNMAAVLIALFQSILWMIVLDLTAIDIQNKLWIVILCLLYSIIFVHIGSFVALIFREMKSSQIVYTLFSITAISLFSPMASSNEILLKNSPAYLLAQTALGFSVVGNMIQILFVALLSVVSVVLVLFLSKRIEKPL